MDYQWDKIVSKSKEGNGIIEVYRTVAETLEILAVLSFSPIMSIRPKEKHVVSLLFIKGSKAKLTDGAFHWIHDDLAEIVKNKCISIYSDNNADDFYLTNVFFVDKLPNIDYFSHGTYSSS